MKEPPVNKVFALACELGAAHGWENITMQDGCQELDVDGHWWFAINPHPHPTRCSRGYKMIPAGTIYFQFNGWPAGIVTSAGGLVACGQAANEETLIDALETAIRKQGTPRW